MKYPPILLILLLPLALGSCAQFSKPEPVPATIQQAHADFCKTLSLP